VVQDDLGCIKVCVHVYASAEFSQEIDIAMFVCGPFDFVKIPFGLGELQKDIKQVDGRQVDLSLDLVFHVSTKESIVVLIVPGHSHRVDVCETETCQERKEVVEGIRADPGSGGQSPAKRGWALTKGLNETVVVESLVNLVDYDTPVCVVIQIIGCGVETADLYFAVKFLQIRRLDVSFNLVVPVQQEMVRNHHKGFCGIASDQRDRLNGLSNAHVIQKHTSLDVFGARKHLAWLGKNFVHIVVIYAPVVELTEFVLCKVNGDPLRFVFDHPLQIVALVVVQFGAYVWWLIAEFQKWDALASSKLFTDVVESLVIQKVVAVFNVPVQNCFQERMLIEKLPGKQFHAMKGKVQSLVGLVINVKIILDCLIKWTVALYFAVVVENLLVF
jgi:hypothetical protein